MGAAVVHFEINSKDAKRAQEFYTNLFDWRVNANNPMNYGVVDTGLKMGINGGISAVQPDKSAFVTFYVQVENPQAYLDKAVALGARVVMPVTEIPNLVTVALFADPDGNVVGLVKGPQTAPVEEKPKAKPKKAAPRKKKVSRPKGKAKRAKGKGRKARRK